MRELSSYERVRNTLDKKPVDEIAFTIDPWPETIKKWQTEGHFAKKDIEDWWLHFKQDIMAAGWLNSTADLDFEPRVLEETDDTILKVDGNGATLRTHKKYSRTPEHVNFVAKDRIGWEKHIKPHLFGVDGRRIPLEEYKKRRTIATEKQLFFCWHGEGPFEQIHSICGHEDMLMGMTLDPDWVRDMVMTYTELTIRHLELLFNEAGQPDGFWLYEDMGFKNKPFMSLTMYEDIVQLGHKRFFDFAHSIGCKVIVHSCGFVEPLVPGLITAGMDCLQAMEVKAGMDMPHLFKLFGDKIAFFGNIDARALITNDYKIIDEELTKKIVPVVSHSGSYILHTDHSEPPEIKYDTMWHFIRRGKEIAKEAASKK
ncbi:MAG: uroporphyrinogen decarboxylase family protein [Phycisphaerae bacterium]|jgi:uroporphyrinogen decarboxylase